MLIIVNWNWFPSGWRERDHLVEGQTPVKCLPASIVNSTGAIREPGRMTTTEGDLRGLTVIVSAIVTINVHQIGFVTSFIGKYCIIVLNWVLEQALWTCKEFSLHLEWSHLEGLCMGYRVWRHGCVESSPCHARVHSDGRLFTIYISKMIRWPITPPALETW